MPGKHDVSSEQDGLGRLCDDGMCGVSHATRVNRDCFGAKLLRRGLMGSARLGTATTYLLHDTSLPLREGDVPTRLVLDELDLNLPALAPGLLVIVVVVIGGGTRAFGAPVGIAGTQSAIVAIANSVVVDRGRRVLVVVGDFRGHGVESRARECLREWPSGRPYCMRLW